jgi:peptidoglycan/LPS O-acetylase OafA/YrhL
MSSTFNIAVNDFEKIGADYSPQSRDVAGAKSSVAHTLPKKGESRLLFIDGLRGVAALLVMLFHFYTPKVSPLYATMHDWMPAPLDWLLLSGYVGVEIFFVLSGFVIAYTLLNEECTPGFAANFMIRRSIRLDPPYWTLIAVSVGYKCILWHHYAGAIISSMGVGNLLVNAFYLTGNAQHPPIVGVAWTLCLEIRFYISLILMLVISNQVRRWISPRAGAWAFAVAFVPLTIVSMIYRFTGDVVGFIQTWYMFAMGATLAWALTKRIRERWFWMVLAMALCGQLWQPDFRASIAVGTLLLIYACAKLDKMSVWLSWGWIQKLGRISYSLYLCHVAVGLAVMDTLLAYGDKSRFLAAVAFVAASLVSILAAEILNKYVEIPCIKLAKLLKPARAAKPEVKEILEQMTPPVHAMPGRMAPA